MPSKKIAIIGGGVIGASCAVEIVQKFGPHTKYNWDVRIIAEQFTPATTGDGAAGLWGPYVMAETPNEQIM